MHPLVSIVIPVYNGADFLRDAIESALAQTYRRIEVVVVNDGSTDGGATEAIAGSFGGRIRYFAKPNGHVASALNHGIENMAGEYFSWLSHDDMYRPDKIESQVSALERLGGRTVVYGDFETLDVETGARVEHRLPDTKPEHFRWFITVASTIHGCTLLVPRACFDECGLFDTGLRTTQDYDMWFRISERFRFVHVPGIVVVSRLHAAQGTRALRDVVVRECDSQLSGFVSRLTDTDLSAASRATPARAYGALAASLQARGYAKSRDAALARARARLRDEPLLGSIATRVAIAARVYANALRPLGRPVVRPMRSLAHRLRRWLAAT
jgi:glycosyltransferase involved in cell wall biosynthesis